MSLQIETMSERFQALNQELGSTKLLAVSKYQSLEAIEELYQLGQRDFGENKVQDLLDKANHFKHLEINWHFIGHLQKNKINQLLKVPNLVSIHSIDSIELLEKILKKTCVKPISMFLQVNTSGESEKHGFRDFEKLKSAVQMLNRSESCFNLMGLMTMGAIRTENFEEDARACFEKLVQMRDQLHKEITDLHHLELSMGMTQDYKIATSCGSSWVRLGSGLFQGTKS